MPNVTTTSIRLPRETLAEVKALAARRGRSFQSYVAWLITQALEHEADLTAAKLEGPQDPWSSRPPSPSKAGGPRVPPRSGDRHLPMEFQLTLEGRNWALRCTSCALAVPWRVGVSCLETVLEAALDHDCSASVSRETCLWNLRSDSCDRPRDGTPCVCEKSPASRGVSRETGPPSVTFGSGCGLCGAPDPSVCGGHPECHVSRETGKAIPIHQWTAPE